MITLAETKTLLQISDTSQDTFITFNIPNIINSVCDHCKNHFLDENIYIKSENVTFANADNSITITDFDDEFIAGDYIRIYESARNNGYALIDSIDDTKLVVSGIEIIDETVESNIIIFRSSYPKSLKLSAAKMLNFLIKNQDPFIKSEKIDDYSVTFAENEMVDGFPKNIMSAFSRFRKFYLKEIYIKDY
jgi:hypothetical protein